MKRAPFSAEKFAEKATLPNVKMIEIKLSQGAKPGHGGILPAVKNTPGNCQDSWRETLYRGRLTADPQRLFDTAGDDAVHRSAARTLGRQDGRFQTLRRTQKRVRRAVQSHAGERQSNRTSSPSMAARAAPGPRRWSTPTRSACPCARGLPFVVDCLIGFDLKKDIRVIAAGKVLSGFHVVRLLAIGADLCNSARGMMLALGCIQSLECNKNTCPTGVTSQDPDLYEGLDITDKTQRIANFHKATVHSVMELLAAAGLERPGAASAQPYKSSGERGGGAHL